MPGTGYFKMLTVAAKEHEGALEARVRPSWRSAVSLYRCASQEGACLPKIITVTPKDRHTSVKRLESLVVLARVPQCGGTTHLNPRGSETSCQLRG
jgi:hypothetical protein